MIITALLLTACLAQAEAAPLEPTGPTPPRTEDPGPAEAAPAPPPGATAGTPATATPSPTAPPVAPSPTPSPSPSASTPTSPANTVSILGGLASRLGSQASALGPSVGFSFGVSFQRRYAVLSPELELGLAADFLFDRFATSVLGSSMVQPGVDQSYIGTRTITETSFGLLQTLGVRTGATRVWFGAGGGVAVGFFSTPEPDLRPGSATATQPFARAVAGADVTINDQTSLGVRAGYTFMLTSAPYTSAAGQTVHPFIDLLDIHVGLFYRFR
jgi:hypothetical protein